MEYTPDNVPNGYYLYKLKDNDSYCPVVRVMERDNRRVVSFINREYPIPLKDIPETSRFHKSEAYESNLGLTPEEVQGREEEMTAYLLESLVLDINLFARGKTQLCVSRKEGDKQYSFILDVKLDTVGES